MHLKDFDVINSLAQNIDYCSNDAVLMSTHNLCHGLEIRKIVYRGIPQFYYTKVGYEGIYI